MVKKGVGCNVVKNVPQVGVYVINYNYGRNREIFVFQNS